MRANNNKQTASVAQPRMQFIDQCRCERCRQFSCSAASPVPSAHESSAADASAGLRARALHFPDDEQAPERNATARRSPVCACSSKIESTAFSMCMISFPPANDSVNAQSLFACLLVCMFVCLFAVLSARYKNRLESIFDTRPSWVSQTARPTNARCCSCGLEKHGV